MNGRSERDQHHSDFNECKIVERCEEGTEYGEIKESLQQQETSQ